MALTSNINIITTTLRIFKNKSIKCSRLTSGTAKCRTCVCTDTTNKNPSINPHALVFIKTRGTLR